MKSFFKNKGIKFFLGILMALIGTSLIGNASAFGDTSPSTPISAQLAQYVLCVYNSHNYTTDPDPTHPFYNNPLSKQICDYYVQKRPGAHELGLDIPISAWLTQGIYNDLVPVYHREDGDQTHRFEIMTDVNFVQYVSLPILNYVNSNPQLDIRYLAVAKDIPIKVKDNSEIMDPSTTGNFDMMSAAQFLSFAVDANTTYAIVSQTLAAQLSGVTLPNGYYYLTNEIPQNACSTNYLHFNPANCTAPPTGLLQLRFAVSYLDAFTLADIKALIDKAQAPAPDLNRVYWMDDRVETTDVSKQRFIMSVNMGSSQNTA